MDDILEDSFDQISSFNIIHRGIHARSATGTEITDTDSDTDYRHRFDRSRFGGLGGLTLFSV